MEEQRFRLVMMIYFTYTLHFDANETIQVLTSFSCHLSCESCMRITTWRSVVSVRAEVCHVGAHFHCLTLKKSPGPFR